MQDPLDRIVLDSAAHRTQLVVVVSREQLQALHDLKLPISMAQYIRNLIRADFEADGLEFPEWPSTTSSFMRSET